MPDSPSSPVLGLFEGQTTMARFSFFYSVYFSALARPTDSNPHLLSHQLDLPALCFSSSLAVFSLIPEELLITDIRRTLCFAKTFTHCYRLSPLTCNSPRSPLRTLALSRSRPVSSRFLKSYETSKSYFSRFRRGG